MQTTAKQISHGVIQIDAAAKEVVAAPSFTSQTTSPASLATHPVATGTPPEPVVQHKTTAQIEQEAAQLAADVEANKTQ